MSDDRGLELLARTLEKSGGVVDNTKEVLEAVAPLARDHAATANQILGLVVAGSEWYMLDYPRDAIRTVLRLCLLRHQRPFRLLGESGDIRRRIRGDHLEKFQATSFVPRIPTFTA